VPEGFIRGSADGAPDASTRAAPVCSRDASVQQSGEESEAFGRVEQDRVEPAVASSRVEDVLVLEDVEVFVTSQYVSRSITHLSFVPASTVASSLGFPRMTCR